MLQNSREDFDCSQHKGMIVCEVMDMPITWIPSSSVVYTQIKKKTTRTTVIMYQLKAIKSKLKIQKEQPVWPHPPFTPREKCLEECSW